jgi:hypothetical protein
MCNGFTVMVTVVFSNMIFIFEYNAVDISKVEGLLLEEE